MASDWANQRSEVRRLLVAAGTPVPSETANGGPVIRAAEEAAETAAKTALNSVMAVVGEVNEVIRARTARGELDGAADAVLDDVIAAVEDARTSVVPEAVAAGTETASAVAGDEPLQASVVEPGALEEAQDKARQLIEDRRVANDEYLRKLGRNAFLLYTGASLAAVVWALEAWRLISGGDIAGSDARWAAVQTAAGGWFVFASLVLLNRGSGGLRRLIIGKDGRFSTSLTQAAMWTLALFYVLTYLFLLARAGCDQACTYSPQFEELDVTYLLLLGGPFAAAAAARASVTAKVEGGSLQKTQAAETTVTDLVSSDGGSADLADTQFFLFNVLALVFFFAAFLSDATKLPDLPGGLVALTSVSALTYATNKAITRNAPVITSVNKVAGSGPIRPGDIVEVRGTNFVPAGAEQDEFLTLLAVKFGDVRATLAPRDETNVGKDISNTRLRVRVPDGLEPGVRDVVVTTAGDAVSNPIQVTVVADRPLIVSARPLPLTPGDDITIVGQFLFSAAFDAAPIVRFGNVARRSTRGEGQRLDGLDRITVRVPRSGLEGPEVDVVVQSLSGASSPVVSLPFVP